MTTSISIFFKIVDMSTIDIPYRYSLINKLISPGTHDLSNTCCQKDLDLRNENPGEKFFDICTNHMIPPVFEASPMLQFPIQLSESMTSMSMSMRRATRMSTRTQAHFPLFHFFAE